MDKNADTLVGLHRWFLVSGVLISGIVNQDPENGFFELKPASMYFLSSGQTIRLDLLKLAYAAVIATGSGDLDGLVSEGRGV